MIKYLLRKTYKFRYWLATIICSDALKRNVIVEVPVEVEKIVEKKEFVYINARKGYPSPYQRMKDIRKNYESFER